LGSVLKTGQSVVDADVIMVGVLAAEGQLLMSGQDLSVSQSDF